MRLCGVEGDGNMIMNNEHQTICNEAIVAYFKVLSWHFSEERK